MVRGIANSKIGFGDLILLLRYFFKLKVSTHPNNIGIIGGALLSIITVAWFKRSALIELRDHVNRISTVQLGKGWDFTLTVITSMILLVTLCMTIFSLITKGYDTYSSSMLMIFGWGCVAFCAVIAVALSKVKDR